MFEKEYFFKFKLLELFSWKIIFARNTKIKSMHGKEENILILEQRYQ